MKILLSIYLFFALILTAYLTSYVKVKGRSAAYVKYFMALCAFFAIYLFGYLMELNSNDLEYMIFWNLIQYLGIPFYPTFWLIVVLLYTRTLKELNGRYIILIFAVPLFIFFIRLTNSIHMLYYSEYTIIRFGDLQLMNLGKGPLYYLNSVYTMLTMFFSTYLCISKLIKSTGIDRKKFRLLFIASVLPYISIIAILIDAGATGLDYSAFFVPLSALFIMMAIAKYDFLELKRLSRKIVFENNSDSIIVVDNELNVVDYNQEAIKFFKNEGLQIDLAPLNSIIDKKKEFYSMITGNDEEYEYLASSSKTYEILSNKVLDEHNHVMGYYKTIRDITDKKNRQDRAEYLAKTDVLSGLNNRREFLRLAEEYFIECRLKDGKGVVALMMDIDNFKLLNDTYGHVAGDDAIRIIGKMIKDTFPSNSVSGRIGGEEFAVLIKKVDSNSSYAIAETFRRGIESAVIPYEDTVIRFTISIGMAICSGQYDKVAELIDAADKAMYISKKSGKNKTTIADKKIKE